MRYEGVCDIGSDGELPPLREPVERGERGERECVNRVC